jgi:hypothetical protein
VTGVYIPRRDTSSRLGALLGGRLVPGWQHKARFVVEEGGGSYRVSVISRDGEVDIDVSVHRADTVAPTSVFASVAEASGFFRCAPMGYAATKRDGVFDGVTLTADGWAVEPLHLDAVRSSFFDDRTRFPAGAAVPDSAFLMANLETKWTPQPALVARRGPR